MNDSVRESIRQSVAAQAKRLDEGKREFRRWPSRRGRNRKINRHMQSGS